MFNPCIMVPVYNHGPQLQGFITELLASQLPIILVNDGSDQATTDIINTIEAEHDSVAAIHLPYNLGKGGAMAAGFIECDNRAYSHCLQIDADGQHDTSDIPKFLALAQQHPNALISGRPIYDESVPKSRLYSRYITHVWVWIETLSLQIKDSMCGFRLYPLEVTAKIARAGKIRPRMDCDTDIMVRLYWDDVPVLFIPTKVAYPEDGLSHFDVVKDNLRITLMHTLLVIGMLLRLPRLLGRKLKSALKPQADEANHWSQTQERGSAIGLKFSLWCYRVLGRRAAEYLLYPIIFFFYISGAKARTESFRFLNRVALMRDGSPVHVTWRQSFRHFMNFGHAILDRLDAWTGRLIRDDLVIDNEPLVKELTESPKGAVLFISHLGNVDVMRALLTRYPRFKLTVLMFTNHAEQINSMMKSVNHSSALNVVLVNEISPATMMMLNERVEAGECVAIAADRLPPSAASDSKTSAVPVDFMGAKALLPAGPFILAALLKCPSYSLYCVRDQDKHRFILKPFRQQIVLPRKQRQALLPEIVQSYASDLEQVALTYPYQWFNFYNFWADETAQTALTDEVQSRKDSND